MAFSRIKASISNQFDMFFRFFRNFKPFISGYLGAIFLLLVFVSFPVIESWIDALMQKTPGENLLQLGSSIVLMMAIFQGFKNRTLKLRFKMSPSWTGLTLLTASIGLHALADFLYVKSIYWITYIGVLAFLVWALGGRRVFVKTLPYFLFTTFLLPVVNSEIQSAISLPLQLGSTWLAANFAGIFVPLTHAQNMLYVRNDAFEITADCSGLQSWIGFLFAGLLRQLFEKTRFLELLLLLPVSLLLALLLNGIRLCITVWVAYWFSADEAMAVHTNLDYFLLPIGFLILWEGGNRLKSNQAEQALIASDTDITPVTPPKMPFLKTFFSSAAVTPPKEKIFCLLIIILFSLLLLEHTVTHEPLISVQNGSLKVPLRLNDWQGSEQALSNEEVRSLAGAAIINREYRRPDGRVLWLTILESPSAQYIHNFWGCLTGQGIQPEFVKTVEITLGNRPFKVPLIQYEYHQKLYYEMLWYQWDQGITANRWRWYQAVLESRFHHRTHHWKIVTVTMAVSKTAPYTEKQAVQAFSRQIADILK